MPLFANRELRGRLRTATQVVTAMSRTVVLNTSPAVVKSAVVGIVPMRLR